MALEEKTYQAYGYVRLSQDDDGRTEESNSIRNQKMLITDFAQKRPDIRLLGFRQDDGCSGVTFERKGFLELMDLIRAGECDCIIVKDLSRFGRNYIESGKLIERLFPALGVRFIAINDGYDSVAEHSLADSMLLPFKNLINDLYSRDISIKVRSNLEVRRKQGDFVGPHPPYGYRRDEREKGRLVPDGHPAGTVKQIFRMRLEGCSRQAIAEYLNQIGEPSPAEYKKLSGFRYRSGFQIQEHARWSAQAIGRILRNEVYTGTLVQKKVTTLSYKLRTPIPLPADQQIRVERTHAAIISPRIFQLVQELPEPARGGAGRYLFSGILRCGRCGAGLEGQTLSYQGSSYCYALCPCCQKSGTKNRVKEEKLYQLVLHILQSLTENLIPMERLLRQAGGIPFQQQERSRLKRQLAQKRQELERYTKFGQSLHADYTRGILSREEMQEYGQEYQARCAEARQAMQRLQQELEGLRAAPAAENSWPGSFLEQKGIHTLSRGLVLSTLSDITVTDARHIRLTFRFEEAFAGRCESPVQEKEDAPCGN